MPSFNKVILCGNLTRDPELAHTTSGTAVCNFGLAVNRHWRSENGEEREDCYFGEVKAFGRAAETICRHMKKGRPILIEGRLTIEKWDDKNTGAPRSSTRIVLESFQFIGQPPTTQETP
jgi:single-strand DNA-binding protein